MTYTASISSRGTITIPKPIRDDIKTSKVVIIKKGGSYIMQPVKKISQLAGSMKTSIKLTDKQLKEAKDQAFLQRFQQKD